MRRLGPGTVEAVFWQTTPPVVVGSRFRFRVQFLGRTFKHTYEVRALEPGVRFVMATAEGPFPMETTCTWDDARPNVTKIRLRNRVSRRASLRSRHRSLRWRCVAPMKQICGEALLER
jgi:hypothetical protein